MLSILNYETRQLVRMQEKITMKETGEENNCTAFNKICYSDLFLLKCSSSQILINFYDNKCTL